MILPFNYRNFSVSQTSSKESYLASGGILGVGHI